MRDIDNFLLQLLLLNRHGANLEVPQNHIKSSQDGRNLSKHLFDVFFSPQASGTEKNRLEKYVVLFFLWK